MRHFSLLSLTLFAIPTLAAAEPPLHAFSALALSPHGDRVLVLETDDRRDMSRAVTHLVLRQVATGQAQTIASCEQAKCTLANPTWAPDGASFVYVVRDRASGMQRLLQVSAGGTQSRTVASLRGSLNAPRFGPNGALAVLATAGAHKEIGATQAGAALVGDIGAAPDVQRIAEITPNGLRTISPPDLFVYEYDWRPQGGFVATGAHGNGDDNWWVARLYALGVDGSAREIWKPQLQIAMPRVSPDGKWVALIGGIMSDFGSTGGDVWVVPADGGAAQDVTPNLKASATSLTWNGRSDRVTFTALAGSEDAVETAAVTTADVRVLWRAPLNINAGDGRISFAYDRTTSAIVRQTFSRPPEIAVGPLGAWRDITHANAGFASATRAQSITWTNDGFSVQGWLLAPLQSSNGKAPMVVMVHGGPSAAFDETFVGIGTQRELLSHGYYMFLPNPRGSFGQGEAFTQANVKDFGGGDLRDILTGIDAAEKVAPIDDGRLGIIGYSYGGYMTMWAVTQTQRFKGAVAGAGISDWLSYYGENGIDQWMIPFFGASVYEDPAVYAKSSPITFIKNVRTPTFEFVGERDIECPMPQSQEFWHALETLGVPTSFVVYPGEGHGLRQPAHQEDAEHRTLAWFDRYLR